MNINRILNLTPKQKIIAASAAGGIIVLGIAITLVVCLGGTTPPEVKPENAPKVAKFMASEQFASLDKTQKQKYVQQISSDPELRQALWQQRESLNEQQQRNLRNNMREGFRLRMQERMDKYFALKTREEKNKMLDEMLAEMQKHQNDRPQRRPPTTQPANPSGSNPQAQPQSRQQRRMERRETVSPQQRAQHRQFRADLVARAKELGIAMPRHRRH